MTEPGGLRVAHLTRDEFATALARGCWLLLPFGAIEQHGPHLPLATDLIEAEHICAAVAARVGGLCAPGLPYGVCRTMRRFPGTISLSPGTFQALVREVVAEYVRHGARKLALYSGHAEPAQLEALREAVLPLVDPDPGLVVLVVGPYAFLDPIRREAGLEGRDGHAASIETSMMRRSPRTRCGPTGSRMSPTGRASPGSVCSPIPRRSFRPACGATPRGCRASWASGRSSTSSPSLPGCWSGSTGASPSKRL